MFRVVTVRENLEAHWQVRAGSLVVTFLPIAEVQIVTCFHQRPPGLTWTDLALDRPRSFLPYFNLPRNNVLPLLTSSLGGVTRGDCFSDAGASLFPAFAANPDVALEFTLTSRKDANTMGLQQNRRMIWNS